ATVDATAGFYGEGKLKLHADVDPFRPRPTFSMNSEGTALPLAKRNDLVDEKLKLEFEGGTLSLFTEVRSDDGAYHGYVKPIIYDPKLKMHDQPQWKKLWAGVVTAISKLFENPPH